MARLIAEFCQNHNGNFDLLKKMVEEAAESGATHGKMQTIFSDTLTFRPQFEDGLMQDGLVKSIKRPYKEEFIRLKNLEISNENTIEFIKICKNNDIVPMTTCFVKSHVHHLLNLGFKSIKVASYDCASFSLLRDLANNFDEIVVSTGATYDDEVLYAAKILKDTNFSMLHCVTLYPTPLDQMHMDRMNWLREISPSVGYSDHSDVSTTGLLASKAALALGADIIERHFTILNKNETKDGPVSINKDQLKDLSDFSKLSKADMVEAMNIEYPDWRVVIGEKNRELSSEELLNRDYYRGRFASPISVNKSNPRMIFNWEEVGL